MDPQKLNLEPDARFPSGPWTGFFLQFWIPGRNTTDVTISYSRGEMTGRGYDRVGSFNIDGIYDVGTGECEWTKQYLGKHSVKYRGVNNGHGIWGVWEIRQLAGLFTDRGGFHIWPEGSDVSEESERTEQAVLEVMRKEFGSRAWRGFWLFFAFAVLVAIVLLVRWSLES
jgi:hypothetical protein